MMIARNFSDADWAATPESVKKAYIDLEKKVFELVEQKAKLEELLYRARVRVNKDSSNSDKPPSSDSPYKERVTKTTNKPKGKPGARRGHKGHRQKLMQPTEVVPVMPDECQCGHKEFENIKEFYRHQEVELPEIKLEVRHFVLHQGDCVACGKTVKAKVPHQHRTGFGPRLSALIGEIVGIQGNSRRTVKEFCGSVLNLDISLGAIQKVIDRVSEAIQPHYQAIAKAARQSEINGIDETTWKRNGKLEFLWAMVNKKVAFFKLQLRRSKEAFQALVEDWKGILISDGYRLYHSWVNLRQSCLAHLIRNAKGLAEHPKKEIRTFAENVLEKLQQLCAMATHLPDENEWNEFYSGFIDLISANCTRYYRDETGKFARRLLKELDSLWVFLEVAGVGPTNNHTERNLRFGVLWRKRSQGTRSDKGDQWIERLLSLRQTARLNNRSSYNLLVNAMECYFKEQTPDLAWISL